MDKGQIILLNGVSSAGKTTLARALAARLPGYFCLGVDDFDLLIERMEDRQAGRLIPVETEYFFHRCVAMFSLRGVPLVVDCILHDETTRADLLAVLADFPVLFVGVHCSPEELARREQARGDRRPGQGAAQLAFVHRQESYDIEVDTSVASPADCAERIIACLRQGRG